MTEAIRWGILGGANFAAKTMGPAIHEAEGAELAMLATSSPDKAARFQAFCPSLNLAESYDALLASDKVDAVYIPLPNHLHVPWAEKALRAGKHVLVEKPIAMKAEEIDRLIALRDETGLFCAEAFMITHHPQWHRVRDLLAGGQIGRLRHVDAAFSFFNDDAANIRNKPETGGGGIRDIGVYAYGSVRFATGAEPVALESRIHWENGVDTWAQAVGEMEGPMGRFTYSGMVSTRMASRQEVTFHGEKGYIRLTAPFNPGAFDQAEVHIRMEGGTETTERWTVTRQYKLQVEAFGRAIGGGSYPCPLEFSRGTQAMIDMVFAAEAGFVSD